MEKKELLSFQRRLEAEKRLLLGQLENLQRGGLSYSEADSIQELSSYDNHPADIASETFEREKDMGLRGNVMVRLQKVADALERVKRGTYGACDHCGRPIDPERLTAMPSAILCIDCQQEQDNLPDRRERPVEEDVLLPPFGHTEGVGRENVAYDGEDAWQDVARYGSSDGPQDVGGAESYDDLFVSADEDIGVVQEVEGLVDEKGEVLGEQQRLRSRRRKESR
ncbi:MAG: TraR/DksA C4-type zinc finger protein [Firmicutes bacterium]|nr:TraR/DksA C4-type zinc finger protein [Bacillota bacterium]